jgi:hypothetical protein
MWKYAYSLLIVCVTCTTVAQTQTVDTTFNREWLDIDSNITINRLPKTALEKVNRLYQKAVATNLGPQQLKCLIYQLTLEAEIKDEGNIVAINRIKAELLRQKDALTRSILHALLAGQYRRYYASNRWQIEDRKNTGLTSGGKIEQWSSAQFDQAILQSYEKGLTQPDELKKMPVNAIRAIVIRGSGQLQPDNWYELILLDRLSYLKDPILHSYQPTTSSQWKQLAFMPPKQFIETTLPKNDSSLEMKVLGEYQKLLLAQRNKKGTTVSVALHIDRLEWAWQQTGGSLANKKKYADALQTLIRNHPESFAKHRAYFLLAELEISTETTRKNHFGKTSADNGYLKADSLLSIALKNNVVVTPEIVALQNLLAEIRQPMLAASMESVYLPGQSILSLIQYQNTPRVFVQIVALETSEWEKYIQQKKPSQNILLEKKPIQEKMWTLTASEDRRKHSTEIMIDPLPAGKYMLLISSQKDISDNSCVVSLTPFQVSSIAALQQNNRWMALNRSTGLPLAGAEYQFYTSYTSTQNPGFRKINAAKGASDSSGLFHFNYKGEYANGVSIRYQKDELLLLGNLFLSSSSDSRTDEVRQENPMKKVLLFTDRKIYRPGQEIFWKGIGIQREKENTPTQLFAEDTRILFYLKDASGTIIDSVEKKLNSYGSCSGSFLLPKDRLTGQFSIEPAHFSYSSATIQVEAYKRPKFIIEWETQRDGYSLYDSIRIKGATRSFAGNVLQQAMVKYRISRTQRYFRNAAAATEISTGTTKTDQEGKFSLHFSPYTDADDLNDENISYSYQITVDVTDASGETRSSQTFLSAGKQSVFVQCQLQETFPLSDWKDLRVFTSNINGEKINAPVQVKLYKLQTPAKNLRKKYWEAPDQPILSEAAFRQSFPDDAYGDELNPANWNQQSIVFEEKFMTQKNGQTGLADIISSPGDYRLAIITKDPLSGKTNETTQYFRVLHENTSSHSDYSTPFTYQNQGNLQIGDTIRAVVSHDHQPLHFIISKSEPFAPNSNWITKEANNGLYTINETTKNTGTIYYHVAYVLNNRTHVNTFQWNIQPANKSLQIKTSSFRHPLEPGSQEKWTLEIKDAASGKAAAELLSTLYDASLDPLAPHEWEWHSFPVTSTPYKPFEFIHNFSPISSFIFYVPEIGNTAYPTSQPDRLCVIAYELINQNRERRVDGKSYLLPSFDYIISWESYDKVYTAPTLMANGSKSAERFSAAAQPLSSENDGVAQTALTLSPNMAEEKIQLRKQLQETAFFFPQVQADSNGIYTLNFTLPESLTRWKWMNFAHTTTLETGSFITEIDTRKPLMVIPQMPRFLREGDQIELITQIVNTGDQELTGQVSLELINVATEKPIDGWLNNVFPVQYFTVGAGKTSIVRFPIQVPYGFNQPLIWRIKAKAGNVSDGEQNMLPIITNRTLVTETKAFWLKTDTIVQFSLPSLLHNKSATLSHQSLQWEVATAPAWYVIKALPYLMENDYPCAEQVWNRIYANQLAAYTLSRVPMIQTALDQWKKDTAAGKQRFEKAADITAVLNKENPWLKESVTEEEQIKSLSRLLEADKLKTELTVLIPALEKFQTASGGFRWLEGGNADEATTLYILSGIHKLNELNGWIPGLQEKLQPMISPAIRFMDSLMHQYLDRNPLKKELSTRNTLPFSWIQYLRLRAHFDRVPKKYPIDYASIRQLAVRNWRSYPPYEQSIIADVMLSGMEKDTAIQKVIPSLLENAVNDTLQGMFWKYGGYTGGYQSSLSMPTQMLKLLKNISVSNDKKYQSAIAAITHWMLQQKRTSHWATTPATAEACYALLTSLPASNLNTRREVMVKTGDMTFHVTPDQAEAGTGYYRQVIEGKKVTASMGRITLQVSTVSNQLSTPKESGPVSGAVYWQYIENIDQIKESKHSNLHIEKKLFRQVAGNTAKTLEPLTPLSNLRKGDRIVTRLIITCQRPMEFIHLKDMRASGCEPVDVISQFHVQEGLSFYQTTLDTHTGFFFRRIEKGTYMIEYGSFLTHPGEFSAGIASVQSLYAPEFQAHSSATILRVGD